MIARFGLFLREVAEAAAIGTRKHPWLGTANTIAGTGLILLGVLVMFLAVRTHQRAVAQVERGELKLPSRSSLSVPLGLVLCAFGVGIAMYLACV